ncbi:7593_t:CDS:2 [Gigaspora margarita]|uniref:7593_t:CDS:1 n=1 Tax=Gigaspora margarita TaxID=4874 RepID=A0ABN7V5S1_GIGMA|nr:7593_t:CDS:2 [Gigaspora margarita]
MFSIIKANPYWQERSIKGSSLIAFDVQFGPDPITKHGMGVTNSTVSGLAYGDVFSKYATVYIDYVSSIEGNKTFSIEFQIATPFSTPPNHILKFNLWDADEHIGCVIF